MDRPLRSSVGCFSCGAWGGAVGLPGNYVRAAARALDPPSHRGDYKGFRVARTYPLSPAVTVPTVDKPVTPPAESSPTTLPTATTAPPAQAADTVAAVAALEKFGAEIKRNGQGKVVEVNLRKTGVTDGALVHLKGLTELRGLKLIRTQVTDAGLEHLKGLTKLKVLGLGGPQVTDAGVAELKKALPNCTISR